MAKAKSENVLSDDMRAVRAKEMLLRIGKEIDAGNWPKAYQVFGLLETLFDFKFPCGPEYGTDWHIEIMCKEASKP
jgi:hypothetical protein